MRNDERKGYGGGKCGRGKTEYGGQGSLMRGKGKWMETMKNGHKGGEWRLVEKE